MEKKEITYIVNVIIESQSIPGKNKQKPQNNKIDIMKLYNYEINILLFPQVKIIFLIFYFTFWYFSNYFRIIQSSY